MQINALFQLASMVRDNSPELTKANKFLMIADLFHYLLTKRIACEYTLATTSQLYDLEEKAFGYKHLTAGQAAKIASLSNAKQLVLTHLSARYKDSKNIEEEAQQIFPNTKVAYDFMKVKLS